MELTGLGAIRRRFVPGPGLDNIIVQIDHDGGGVPERLSQVKAMRAAMMLMRRLWN